MVRLSVVLAVVALAALAGGCVSTAPESPGACTGEAWSETRLFLGRGSPSGQVSEAQWRQFVDTEVTTLLRDGFTVLDGVGFWRDPSTGRSAMEASKVLVVLHPRTAAFDEAVAAISARYLARFGQTAVLRADQPVCVSFHSRSS